MTAPTVLPSRSVFFCGAGISLDPPAGLPDWHHLRDYTIEAVGGRDPFLAQFIGGLTTIEMLAVPGKRGMAPEVVGSIIAQSCHGYFESFRGLNEGDPNANHRLLAKAAREGRIEYIVTTNFDRFLEQALEQERIAFRLYRTEEEFAAFDLIPGVHLLKLHGCISIPETITVTVEDEGKGLPASKNAALDKLLERFPFVFWGYSGADLKIDPDYLRMITARPRAPGFVWSLYRNQTYQEPPNPYLLRLQAEYGERGAIVHGLLPEALAAGLTRPPAPAGQTPAGFDREKWAAEKDEALQSSLRRWANRHVPPIMAVFIFGELHSHNGQHAQALACFREMVTRARREGNQHALMGALGGAASAWHSLGDNVQAKTAYQQLLETARQHQDSIHQSIALSGLGGIYRAAGELDRAIECYRGAEERAEGYAGQGIDTLLTNIGDIYSAQGNVEPAMEKFQQAEALVRDRGWKRRLPGILHKLGSAHASMGEWDAADRYYAEELELAKALGDRIQVGYCYREMAAVHIGRKQIDPAPALLDSAFHIARAEGEKALETVVMSDRALILLFQGRTAEAGELYQRTAELAGAAGDKRTLGRIHFTLAGMRHKSEDAPGAEESFRRAIDILEQAGDRFTAAEACRGLARLLMEQKRAEEAYDFLRKSLAHYHVAGLDHYAPQVLPEIAAAHAAVTGKPEPPLVEVLRSALERSHVDATLAEKIARRGGWAGEQFQLDAFAESEARQHGRELAAYWFALAAKHVSIGFKEARQFPESLVCAALGFDISAQIGEARNVSIFLNDMGYLYGQLKMTDKAVEYLEYAIAAERMVGHPRELTIRLINLGRLYDRLGRDDEAERAFRDAVKTMRGADDPQHFLLALLGLADLLKIRKNPEALEIYREAEPLARRNGDRESLIRVYMGLGKMYLEQKKYLESVQNRAEALELSVSAGEDTAAANLAFLIGNTYDRFLHQPAAAAPYYQRALEMAERFGEKALAERVRAAMRVAAKGH